MPSGLADNHKNGRIIESHWQCGLRMNMHGLAEPCGRLKITAVVKSILDSRTVEGNEAKTRFPDFLSLLDELADELARFGALLLMRRLIFSVRNAAELFSEASHSTFTPPRDTEPEALGGSYPLTAGGHPPQSFPPSPSGLPKSLVFAHVERVPAFFLTILHKTGPGTARVENPVRLLRRNGIAAMEGSMRNVARTFLCLG
ncbi:hypothetical protein K438DRAFT_1771929 [Mycena galopus ATCC 62051]|nr:hypothetical protein K438DRAFT_1771929 [Mycena galopus ATCC 62051]